VILLDPVDDLPDPPRPLGPAAALWRQIWAAGRTWIGPSDVELVLLVCESIDERVALRMRMLRAGNDVDWRDRVAFWSLDDQVRSMLSMLAFTPTARSRLGVAEVRRASALGELLGRGSPMIVADAEHGQSDRSNPPKPNTSTVATASPMRNNG
jgi:hypothetical protein